VRTYRGLRLANGSALVQVVEGGDDARALVPTEGARFTWGESSTGSVALARAILVDHLGALPSRGVAHRFAFLTTAAWTATRWLLTSSEIDLWLVEVRATLRLSCLLCGDTGRREVMPGLWRRCECRPAEA